MNSLILSKVLVAVAETTVFMLLGVFAVRRRMILKDSMAGLSRFAVNVLTPFLIFSSIAGNYSAEELLSAWIYPVGGFLMIALHAVLGFVFVPLLRHRENGRFATFCHMAALNNYLYLPLIIVTHIWGGKTVGALLLWSVGSTLAQWSIGVGVMAGAEWKKMIKNVFSANFFAAMIAIFFVMFSISLPAAVMRNIDAVGKLAIPLCLILVGASICTSAGELMKFPLDLGYTVLVRLIFIPLLTIGLLKLLELPEMLHNIAAVLAVMPGASGSVLVVREYGGDPDFAGQIVLATTALGMVTMPLLLTIAL